MEKEMKGKAIIAGDDVSTDDIIPGRFAHLRSDLPELAKHAFEDRVPGFADKVNAGDAINQGVPVLICDTDGISDGDELEIRLTDGVVVNHSTGVSLSCGKMPALMSDILAAGGLVPYIREHGSLDAGD